jgi:chromosome partitioning protein
MPVIAVFNFFADRRRLSELIRPLAAGLRLVKWFVRRIVVTRFDSRRRRSSDVHGLLSERFGETLCKTVITETVALAESPMHGKDIFSYAALSQGAADHRALTEELATGNFFT